MCIRDRCVPMHYYNIAEVIMVSKHGKSPNKKTSYLPTSLLPIISKLFENLLLKCVTNKGGKAIYSNPTLNY